MLNKKNSSKDFRDKSFKKFIQGTTPKTIKEKVVSFLFKNPSRSYTAAELQLLLSIRYRSSICHPLLDLVERNIIEVSNSFYDKETNREVGAYRIVKSLFSL